LFGRLLRPVDQRCLPSGANLGVRRDGRRLHRIADALDLPMTDELLERYGFDPAAADADESRALLAFALESGASEEEIRHAIEGGFLHAVPVRRGLVGGRERWTFAEIAKRAGLDTDFARRVWIELGLPEDEVTSFSERD